VTPEATRSPSSSDRLPGSGRLPTFLIIGAMKGGTSTLARTLAQHPQVFVPRGKEMHFFDQHFDRGLDWYRSWFEDAGAATAVGEASPTYLHNDEALSRMAGTLPDARLIAILRDPVDRAYSHYWHNVRRGREPLSFREALEAEPGRRESPSGRKGVYAYVDQGRYVRQLQKVVMLYPREALLVLVLEEFSRDPVDGLRAVWRFLRVDEGFVPSRPDAHMNRARRYWSLGLHRYLRRRPRTLPTRVLGRLNIRPGRPHPPMDPTLRAELAERFREDNRALAQWLGREPGLWEGGVSDSREGHRGHSDADRGGMA
jgi:sulfotransferase family protein